MERTEEHNPRGSYLTGREVQALATYALSLAGQYNDEEGTG